MGLNFCADGPSSTPLRTSLFLFSGISVLAFRYQEIATLAMKVRREKADVGQAQAGKPSKSQEQDLTMQVAQEVYRVVLFAVFMLQTYVAGLFPFVGMSYPSFRPSPSSSHLA